jgi:hypothetical protein
MKHLMLILVLSISFFACSDNTQQNDSKLIEFKGRSIDLRPYFDGFLIADSFHSSKPVKSITMK